MGVAEIGGGRVILASRHSGLRQPRHHVADLRHVLHHIPHVDQRHFGDVVGASCGQHGPHTAHLARRLEHLQLLSARGDQRTTEIELEPESINTQKRKHLRIRFVKCDAESVLEDLLARLVSKVREEVGGHVRQRHHQVVVDVHPAVDARNRLVLYRVL